MINSVVRISLSVLALYFVFAAPVLSQTSRPSEDSSVDTTLNREKEARLVEISSALDEAISSTEKSLSDLLVGEQRMTDDSASWQKVSERIRFSLEDESFVPGSQDFTSQRADVANRILASNKRVTSPANFFEYYGMEQGDRPVPVFDGIPTARENDPPELKTLISVVETKREQLARLEQRYVRQTKKIILASIEWEREYRKQLLSTRGLLINEVISESAFEINNVSPITLEFNTITSTTKFYFWSKAAEKSAQQGAKRLISFSDIRDIFKLFFLAAAIFFLIKYRNRIFDKARVLLLQRFGRLKQIHICLSGLDLARELFLFILLLFAGELIIKAAISAGVDFAYQFKPVLHVVIIFYLVHGIIRFVSPKFSHRERRSAKNSKEVKAVETVFKYVPTVYLFYWLVDEIVNSILSENLNQSLLGFYLGHILTFIAICILLVGIRLKQTEWRLINDKATHSIFWKNLSERAKGKVWEPLVLLAGGGIGVYRVSWHFLIERISEVEMGKRFQAMLSRALLERQYRKSMRVIDQTSFPEPYWRSFSFRTPADASWYVPRNEAESVLQESLTQWCQEHEGRRVLLCGDRGIGKSEIIRNLCDRNNIKMSGVKLAVGSTDSVSLCNQISQSLLGRVSADPEDLVNEINALPPSVMALENIENSLLRKVGGFEVFAFIIDLLLKTSQRHYWLCTCTSFSWTIAKQAVAGSSCFNQLVVVTGMSEEDLKKMILNRHFATHKAPPDFSHISTSNQISVRNSKVIKSKVIKSWSDSEQEEKNAELYFRILWDYTRGNPRQALYFWKSSLEWRDGNVTVHLFDVPEQRILENLSDSTLMLLAAIIERNGLTQTGLADVMNTSLANIRRRLEELAPYNMLYRFPDDEDPGWHVESFWVRAVENYLEKRKFLFRGDDL